MPIYDYVCEACGERLEVMHGVNAEGPSACAACGGRMRKALSAPAIVFKGSGWAKVDARRSAPGSTSNKDADKSADDGKPAPSDKTQPTGAASDSAASASTTATTD